MFVQLCTFLQWLKCRSNASNIFLHVGLTTLNVCSCQMPSFLVQSHKAVHTNWNRLAVVLVGPAGVIAANTYHTHTPASLNCTRFTGNYFLSVQLFSFILFYNQLVQTQSTTYSYSPTRHIKGPFGDGWLYRSDDPTNSVTALKDDG